MLKGLNPLLNAEVLYALRAMGHGDDLIIADTHFPSDSVARRAGFGELLRIETAFIRVGEKSCTHLNRMYNVDTGTLTATLESVEVFFDPVARVSAPMPDDIRALLTEALVTVDDG